MRNKRIRLVGAIVSALFTVGGEYYYKRIASNDSQADFFLVLGILAIVIVDQIIQIFGKDSEDVLKRLDDFIPANDDESSKALEPFRGKGFHHYHLTQDKSGNCIWSYKVIEFEHRLSGRTLVGWGPIMPNLEDQPKDHIYRFELSVDGEHLVMQAHHRDGRSDMGFGVIPHLGIPRPNYTFPACGLRIINTFTNEIASTISLISNIELECVQHLKLKNGAPIHDETTIRMLEDEWERHKNKIMRLPLGRILTPPPAQIEVLSKEQWDSTYVENILQSAVKGDEVDIWTTFFVHDPKMESIVRELISRDVVLRIMIMNPDNEELVRSRFRLRRGYSKNPPVRAQDKIREQIASLRGIAEECGKPESLEVRETDTMPFGSFYAIGEKVILVGLLLTEETWEEGPLIKVYPGSKQWAVLKRSWQVSWDAPLDCQCESGMHGHERRRCFKPVAVHAGSVGRKWSESHHLCKDCHVYATDGIEAISEGGGAATLQADWSDNKRS